ncbi:MAG TPA: SCO family protein [Anaerolineales bacterium]
MRRLPGILALLYFLTAVLAPGKSARADSPDPTPDPIKDVAFDQHLNVQVPLDLTFRDESGKPVRLGDYLAGAKPAVLQFAYYNCPMLCNLVFADLAKVLGGLNLGMGDEYQMITVSINPRDTPAAAAAKKAAFLRDHDLPKASNGWHFLTGDPAAIDRLTQAAGFRYAYDAQQDQYAHPTGIVILTPQGKISRYLLGIDYSAKDLRLGLVEASANKIGTPVDQFFLLCYRYDPVSGRYSLLIDNILKMAGTATALIIAGLVLILSRKDRLTPRSG